MTAFSRSPSGMVDFAPVWLGQMVSVLATAMSQFALTIWVYERTGSATALGLMQVFFTTPSLLLSPIAGAMVDRYNRKAMMMVSDLCAGLATIFILILCLAICFGVSPSPCLLPWSWPARATARRRWD